MGLKSGLIRLNFVWGLSRFTPVGSVNLTFSGYKLEVQVQCSEKCVVGGRLVATRLNKV